MSWIVLLLCTVATCAALEVKYHRGLVVLAFRKVVEDGDFLVAETDTDDPTFLFSLNITRPHMVFALANIRQPVILRHLRANHVLVSESEPLQADALSPMHGHLSLTTNLKEMSITWISNATTNPLVRWGLSAVSLNNNAPAVNLTYKISDMCAAPATDPHNFLDPGIIYTAVMTNLPYDTDIFYAYGSAAGWSPVSHFRLKAPATSAMKFIAFGDLGVAPHQQPAAVSTERMMQHLNTTELVVHVGDISYARGHAYIWEQFFNEIQPVSTRVPYMTSIGNHEFDFKGQPFKPSWSTYSTDSGGECGVPYVARFAMPYPDHSRALHNRSLYYSFNYGPVHFAMLDSESDFLPGSPQFKWLNADLAAVDRRATPFVIVTNHRPLYDSSWGGLLPEVEHVRQSLEPVLVQYAVDVVLVGHIHVYQRSCRVIAGVCNSRGPVHVTIGMAGNIAQTPWLDEPAWLVTRSLNHGIGLFTVANSTAMRVQFERDTTGVIEDDFWVYR